MGLNSSLIVVQSPWNHLQVGIWSVNYLPNDHILIKNSWGHAGCLCLKSNSHVRHLRDSLGNDRELCVRGRITGQVDREIKTSKNFCQLPPPHPPSTGALIGIQHERHASITAVGTEQHMCPSLHVVNKHRENEMTDLLNIYSMLRLKIGF